MTFVVNRRMRLHALSFATAIAISALAAPAIAGKADLAGLSSGETYDQFIVGYRKGTPERISVAKAKEALARAAATNVGGKALAVRHLRRMGTGSDVVRADRKLDRVDAESLMRQIAADPEVEYVSVDRRLQALMTPNDPRYLPNQWDMHGTYGIRANQAWSHMAGDFGVNGGLGVVVAVIDTGIANHSDLNANILPGYDFIGDTAVSNDGNGRDSDPSDPGDWVATNQCAGNAAQDSSWHGTHVAGIIAAVANNAKGVAGVAYRAKIVPVRVLGRCGGYTSDIADGIVWASGGSVPGAPANANPAEVINMSLGGWGACDDAMQDAINVSVGLGTTVVVAAGNSDAHASNFTPAGCNNVITVGSTTITGERSDFSNHGSVVDIAAPGSYITSTFNAGAATPGAEGYGSKDGTSMAAPHVAGTVALVQSFVQSFMQAPKTPAQMETLLKCTATPFPSTPSKPIGTGIVNALDAVRSATVPPTTPLSVAGNGGPVIPGQTVGIRTLTASGPGRASCKTQVFVSFGSAGSSPQLELIAPDGSVYPLPSVLSGLGGGQPYTLNLFNEARAGTWQLRINNTSTAPVTLLGWSMSFN